jgi:hypothetical protein
MKIGSCTGFLSSLIGRYTTYVLTKYLRLGVAYSIPIEQQYAKEKEIRSAMLRSGFRIEHEKFMRTGFSTFEVLAELLLGENCINLGDYLDNPSKSEIHYIADYKNRKKELKIEKKRIARELNEIKLQRLVSIKDNLEAFLQDDNWFVDYNDDPQHVVYVEDIIKAVKRRNQENGIESRYILHDGTKRHDILRDLGYKIVRDHLCVQCDETPKHCKCTCKTHKRKCGPRYILGYKLLR